MLEQVNTNYQMTSIYICRLLLQPTLFISCSDHFIHFAPTGVLRLGYIKTNEILTTTCTILSF